MTIRKANSNDVPDIKILLQQLGYPDITPEQVRAKVDQYAQSDYMLLVADEAEGIVGFISLHCFDIFHSPGKMGRITAFCVDERFRRKGIGKHLLLEAEKYFVTQGCTKLEVTSNARRHHAHEFYLRLGYTEDSRRFVKYVKEKND